MIKESFYDPHKDPKKTLSLRMIAMPKDTNSNGDIFGGWLLSLMDIAGAARTKLYADKRAVTVGVKEMKFIKPVSVGEEISCYTEILKIGRTSITIEIDVYVKRLNDPKPDHVITGVFTYVTINDKHEKVPVES